MGEGGAEVGSDGAEVGSAGAEVESDGAKVGIGPEGMADDAEGSTG